MAGALLNLPTTASLITAAIVWAAAWVDVRTRRIPNAFAVTGAALGLLIFLEADGLSGVSRGLAGLGLGLILMLPGYLLRSTGAGDVKLMAAVGALLGPERVLLAWVLAVLSGAAVAGAYAVRAWRTRGARAPWGRYGQMLRTLLRTGRTRYVAPAEGEALNRRFAFGPAIAIGSTVAAWLPVAQCQQ